MYCKITVVGRLAADPELNYTTAGTSVCNFTVAYDTGYGENKDTVFMKCVAWKTLAENVAQYVSKGSQVFIEGELVKRKWSDKEGNNRETCEIVANTVKFLGSKNGNKKESSVEDPF